MKVFRLYILLAFFAFSYTASAQTDESTHFNSWWSLKVKLEVNDHFYVQSQISLRRYDFLKSWQRAMVRARGLYKFNNQFAAGLGYTYSRNFEPSQAEQLVAIPRNDVFTEFRLINKYDDLLLLNRFRLEHRFTGIIVIPEDVTEKAFIDGVKFSNRLRYRITFKHPIKKKNGITQSYAAGFYELFVRMDGLMIKNVSGNIFKLVYGHHLNNKFTIEAGFRRSIKHDKSYSYKEINNILDIALKYRFNISDVIEDKFSPMLGDQE